MKNTARPLLPSNRSGTAMSSNCLLLYNIKLKSKLKVSSFKAELALGK